MTGPADSSAREPRGLRSDAGEVVEALSVRFRAPLRRFFEKRGILRDEVDDLVQEVFARLVGQPGLASMERLEAYLFATASNLLRDRYRRLQSQAAQAHEPYDEAVHGGLRSTEEPDRALLGAQIVERLVAALYELPERTRAVFTLYHLEDLPHREIAHRLDIAVSTIEKHVARANAHLLRRLEGFL